SVSDFRRAHGARAEDVRGQPPTLKLRRAKEDRGQRRGNDEIRMTKDEGMTKPERRTHAHTHARARNRFRGWPRRIRPLADLLKVIGYLGSGEHEAWSTGAKS